MKYLSISVYILQFLSSTYYSFWHIYLSLPWLNSFLGNLFYLMQLWMRFSHNQFSQFSRSVMSDSLWPHGLQHANLPVHHQLPELTQTHVHLSQWCHPTISSCHPLLLPSSIFPSIRVFSSESVLHIRWPKYGSFSFSIGPSNKYSRRVRVGQ